MAEQPSRKRRIVSWSVISVAAAMLLLGGYASSFLVLDWMVARSQIGGSSINFMLVADIQRRFHQPTFRYETTDWPGASALTVARVWCRHNALGDETSWGELQREAAKDREQMRRRAIERAARSHEKAHARSETISD